MSTLIPILAIISILIFFNALYVAAEFSTVSARRTRVSQMAGSGNRLAQMLVPFIEDSASLDRYVAACQLGITVSSLVLGAYGQNVVSETLAGPIESLIIFLEPVLSAVGVTFEGATTAVSVSISVTAALILLTILQVILGELFPKSVAVQYPEQVSLLTVVPMKWSVSLFHPLIWFFNGSGNLVLKLLGMDVSSAGHGHVHSPAEIEILVTESHEGGLLDDEERQMLRNAFRLRELNARQVMVHRTRIIAAPVESSVVELMNVALEAGHTRIPLFQDNIDNIIGFVHVKDLFRLFVEQKENLAEILREVVYVPETLAVVDVWETLSSKRQYMAVVFDEFGGTSGLITFEDLIEEIFGELQDEFDDETALISLDAEGRIYLRGDLLVTDVNEYLGLGLPDTADTLGGLVFSALGRPPDIGDEVAIEGTEIRVEAMDDLSVSEVSVQTAQTDRQSVAKHIGDWEVAEHE